MNCRPELNPMLTQSQCLEINAAVDMILRENPRGNGELHAHATRFVHPVLSKQFPEFRPPPSGWPHSCHY